MHSDDHSYRSPTPRNCVVIGPCFDASDRVVLKVLPPGTTDRRYPLVRVVVTPSLVDAGDRPVRHPTSPRLVFRLHLNARLPSARRGLQQSTSRACLSANCG